VTPTVLRDGRRWYWTVLRGWKVHAVGKTRKRSWVHARPFAVRRRSRGSSGNDTSVALLPTVEVLRYHHPGCGVRNLRNPPGYSPSGVDRTAEASCRCIGDDSFRRGVAWEASGALRGVVGSTLRRAAWRTARWVCANGGGFSQPAATRVVVRGGRCGRGEDWCESRRCRFGGTETTRERLQARREANFGWWIGGLRYRRRGNLGTPGTRWQRFASATRVVLSGPSFGAVFDVAVRRGHGRRDLRVPPGVGRRTGVANGVADGDETVCYDAERLRAGRVASVLSAFGRAGPNQTRTFGCSWGYIERSERISRSVRPVHGSRRSETCSGLKIRWLTAAVELRSGAEGQGRPMITVLARRESNARSEDLIVDPGETWGNGKQGGSKPMGPYDRSASPKSR
jgi:hypothetical protein